MAIRDHIPELLGNTRKLERALDSYVGKSERLAAMFGDDGLAKVARSLKPTELGGRELTGEERRRIAVMLGKQARESFDKRLRADREDPRFGFSLDAFEETVLPVEASIADCRHHLSSLRQLLESESDEAVLQANAADLFEQIDDCMPYLDHANGHQDFIDQMFAAFAVQTAGAVGPDRQAVNKALQLRKDASADAHTATAIWRRLAVRLRPLVSGDASQASDAPASDPPTRKRPPTEYQAMARNTEDNSLDDIVDAVSRLQEGGSGAAATGVAAGVTFPDFGKALDQQIYATIGVPALTSEVTLLADKSEIVEKLFNGLNRTMVREELGEGVRFSFNPLRARILTPATGGSVLGAQGIVAETVALLKPAIISCIERLEPEICQCSDDEIDDLKVDIERGLDMLVRESYSATGVYRAWAQMLVERIVLDIVAIIEIYGIHLDDHVMKQFQAARTGDPAFVARILSAREFPGADRDIGYLGREKNEAAIEAIIVHIVTIWRMLLDLQYHPRGPLTARLRAVVEAIPPAVADVRAALNLAGVSDIDRAAKFLPALKDRDGIELSRILDITEATANEYRVLLLEEQINKRDIGWFISTFEAIDEGLPAPEPDPKSGEGDLQTATINRNRYALGARQLAELKEHVGSALTLARELFGSITDRRQFAPPSSAKPKK